VFLFLSPAAAVISVVGVAFSSLALHGISRHSEKTAAITHQAMEDMSGSAIEYIRGLSIVKSFGQEGASIESFRKANTDLKNIHIKVEKGYTPFNCLHLFSLKLASMGIVFICAWQTLNGQMSLAYFLMFVLFSFVNILKSNVIRGRCNIFSVLVDIFCIFQSFQLIHSGKRLYAI